LKLPGKKENATNPVVPHNNTRPTTTTTTTTNFLNICSHHQKNKFRILKHDCGIWILLRQIWKFLRLKIWERITKSWLRHKETEAGEGERERASKERERGWEQRQETPTDP
jgi:hypothetical protein